MVIEKKTGEVAEAAWAELDDVLALGGAFEAIDELKGRLVRQPGRARPAHRDRRAPGRRVNGFTDDGTLARWPSTTIGARS